MAIRLLILLVTCAAHSLAAAQLVQSLTPERTSVVGGDEIPFIVILDSPAPAGGKIVTLSDNSGSISTPASVFVPQGETAAGFQCTSSVVTGTYLREVTASLNGSTIRKNITLVPQPIVSSVTFFDSDVVGGAEQVVVRILLSTHAPRSGMVVVLSESSSALSIATPAFIMNAGLRVANGLVQTSEVSAIYNRGITVSANGSSFTAYVNIHPPPVMVSAYVVNSLVTGGDTLTLVIFMSGEVAPGSPITITDDSASIASPASANFNLGPEQVLIITTSAVAVTTKAKITVTVGTISKEIDVVLSP